MLDVNACYTYYGYIIVVVYLHDSGVWYEYCVVGAKVGGKLSTALKPFTTIYLVYVTPATAHYRVWFIVQHSTCCTIQVVSTYFVRYKHGLVSASARRKEQKRQMLGFLSCFLAAPPQGWLVNRRLGAGSRGSSSLLRLRLHGEGSSQ